MNRITPGSTYLGVAMAFCVGAMLLAGCGTTSSTPASASPGVFVATATDWSSQNPGATYTTVSSLAPDTGKVRWQHREEWHPFHGFVGKPVVVNGVVYMVADTNTTSTDPAHPLSGMLLALRASDGQQLWRADIGAWASRPIVNGDTIYVSAEHIIGKSGLSKEVYALKSSDGTMRWKTEIPNTRTIRDALVLSQGRLFIGASQVCFDSCAAAYLFALDAGSGHIIWQRSFSGNFTIQPPVVDGGVLYVKVPGYGAGLLALSAVDGHQLWEGTAGNYVVTGGVVYTDKVISAPDPNRSDQWKYAVVALDGTTGTERWQTPTGIYPAVIAVEGDRVIVKSETPNPQASMTTSPYLDVLSTLSASDGKPLWSAQQDAYESSVTASDGAFYLTLPPTRSSGQHYAAALRVADGHVLWRQPVGPTNAEIRSGLPDFGGVASTGDLFCVAASGILYGIGTTDGHTRWSANLSASGQLVGVTIVA